jgi:hypothetical protein
MSKTENRNMGKKRKQEDKTPQKTSNSIIEDSVEIEGNKSPHVDLGRIMRRMFSELKENMQSPKSNPIAVFALDLMSTYEGEHTIFGLLGQANLTLNDVL